jgi:hypothetical protein
MIMRRQPNDVISSLSKRGVVRSVRGIKASTPITFVRSYGNDTMYLFQKGTQGIITSTDDTLPLILGESDKADFTVEIPINLEEWLMGMDEEISSYLQSDAPIDLTEDAADNDRFSISPIIKSRWAQDSPFNNALFIEGKYRKVGCNAIAIGQLLRHFGVEGVDGVLYRRGCKKTPIYTTRTLGLKIDSLPPKAIFDYSRMPQKAPTATDSKNAVSTFLAYISKAITSDFKDTATAASPTYASQVLKTYFKMGETELVGCNQIGASAFEDRIYNELVNGYPVIINGYNDKTGHCFLCDGYDADSGRFHFNLGWGGNCDGYYRLSALNPKKNNVTLDYNARKTIVVVHPIYQWGDANSDGNVDISDVVKVANDNLNGINNPNSDVNNDGKVDKNDAEFLSKKIIGK